MPERNCQSERICFADLRIGKLRLGILAIYLSACFRVWETAENAKPEHVLKYLARYMRGGPISDRQLISHDQQTVSLLGSQFGKPQAGRTS